MAEKHTRPRILVADDKEDLLELYAHVIRDLGYDVETASDGVEAINRVNEHPFDAVLLDLNMPRLGGLEVLPHIKERAPTTEVIIITGVEDIPTVVRAMQMGAFDYLTKPIRTNEIGLVLQRALERAKLQKSATLLEHSLQRVVGDESIVGKSKAWLTVLETAHQYALTDSLVYIEGETGSGKEVIAKYIHLSSERHDQPFVPVDCGVITDTLIESELFGHVKGAFTGATEAKSGLVELAHRGTLFLDEIGHIGVSMQQKLLKFVETKTFRRVGDTTLRSVDVRIVVATNKNLEEEVKAGRFRSDLWYRLNVLKLTIPPLRARPDDILPLAEHFLARYARRRPSLRLSDDAATALRNYLWPGNVRELQAVIQRAVALTVGDFITSDHMGITRVESRERADLPVLQPPRGVGLGTLKDVEEQHIRRVIQSVNGNISEAARVLGIGRNTIYQKLKQFGIEIPKS